MLGLLAFVPHSSGLRANFVDAGGMASELLELTNNVRRSNGLHVLKENSQLTQAAYAKANDMLAQGYFSHTSPDGKAFYRWVDSTGYEYSAVAENLAVNLNMVSAEQMVASWLNSPGHRANLLSGQYTEVGMGVSHGLYQGQEAVFAVHVFAHPKNKKVAAIPKTEPVKTPTINTQLKKIAEIESPTKILVKNIDVLGESISTEVTSPEIATTERRHEILAATSTTENPVVSSKSESYARKSWLQKVLDFFSML